MATPWLVVFMLFNGLIVTKATAPVYLRWVFEISPTSYAMQAIFLTMTEDAGGENNPLIKNCGYQHGHDLKGIVVIISMTVVLRVLQVLALKFLNNSQKWTSDEHSVVRNMVGSGVLGARDIALPPSLYRASFRVVQCKRT
mmetsp:Transcript_103142/g.330693  ORF Transcript_103142/g.330693 Transcript_103142/m.330693 type:complete len:141 (-) Transcript_103142:203-625(-)